MTTLHNNFLVIHTDMILFILYVTLINNFLVTYRIIYLSSTLRKLMNFVFLFVKFNALRGTLSKHKADPALSVGVLYILLENFQRAVFVTS